MLKKLIKELPFVPDESCDGAPKSVTIPSCHPNLFAEDTSLSSTGSIMPGSSSNSNQASTCDKKSSQTNIQSIATSPGEKAFFRLLHFELKKTQKFFSQTQKELQIREERVREGFDVMKRPHPFMVNDKWLSVAKSVYNLYKDLILLETYAIMAYCSFSKILKKHDKVTGYETRKAFMMRLVNKTEFVSYPTLIEMISRTESLHDEVSLNFHVKGKEGLSEDERLFINMIHRLNSQIMSKTEKDTSDKCIQRICRDIPVSLAGDKSFSQQLNTTTNCKLTDSIKNLVAENDRLLRPKLNTESIDENINTPNDDILVEKNSINENTADVIGKHKFSHKMRSKNKRLRQI